VVTAEWREAAEPFSDVRGRWWFGRVIDGDQTVFDAEPARHKADALFRALGSPAVAQARRDRRPVKVQTDAEPEREDDL